MDSFEKNLNKAITSNLTDLFKQAMSSYTSSIAEKNDLEVDDLLEIWNDSNGEAFKLTKSKAKPKAKAKGKGKKKDDDSDENICQAIVKATKTPCTFKVSDKSKSGKFCGRHLKNEDDEDDDDKPKKSKAKAKPKAKGKAKTKKAKDDDDEDGDDDGSDKEEEEPPKVKISLKKDAFGRFIDKETKFVFNQTDKCVIGKGNDDGTLSPLTDEDKKLCKSLKYNFKVEEKKVESDDDDEDDKKKVVEKKTEKKTDKEEKR